MIRPALAALSAALAAHQSAARAIPVRVELALAPARNTMVDPPETKAARARVVRRLRSKKPPARPACDTHLHYARVVRICTMRMCVVSVHEGGAFRSPLVYCVTEEFKSNHIYTTLMPGH